MAAAPLPDGGVIMTGLFLNQPLTVRFGLDGKAAWADVYIDADRHAVTPAAVYADSFSNAYLVLKSKAELSESPWVTVVKYSPLGQRQWITSHPGLHSASAIDAGGNIVLGLKGTFPVADRPGLTDYAVVRISAAGDIRWRVAPDQPWGGTVGLSAMRLDERGNIYLTGLRYRNLNATRVATVAIDTGGSMRWEVMHVLPEEQSASAAFLSVDLSGNASVIAQKGGTSSFEMVRYNAEGMVQWVRQLSGTSSWFANHPSGDQYLVTQTNIQRIDTSGIITWTQDRNGATAFCAAGGLLFTGSSTSGITTITAYADRGAKEWTAHSIAPTGSADELVTVVCDGTGSVTAVETRKRTDGGADFVGHAYSPAGSSAATLHYVAPAASDNRMTASCVDQSGNIYLVGSRSSALGEIPTIVKYSPTGDTLFVREMMDAATRNVHPLAATVDELGKLRVLGYGSGSLPVLFCFSGSGLLEWSTTSTHTLNSSSPGMRTDARGNTIVFGGASYNEAVVVAFSPAGRELWVGTLGGVRNSISGACMDSEGNVYLGATVGGDNAATGTLVKYSPEGQKLWVRKSSDVMVPIQGNGTQQYAGLSALSSGGCVVACKDWKSADSTNSLLLLCYSAEGELLWWRRDMEGMITFYPVTILREHNDGLVLTGRGSISQYGLFEFVLRCDPQGNRLSRTHIPGDYYLGSAILDGRSGVCLTGTTTSYTSGGNLDVFTLGYGPSGSLAWIERFDAVQGAHDEAIGISVGLDGMITVTGNSQIPLQSGPPRETGRFFTVIGYARLNAPGSLIDNPGFESELRSWVCNTNGSADIAVAPIGEQSSNAVEINVRRPDSNIILYQSGIPLEPHALYRLTFSARCSTGHDVAVSLIQDGQPYQTYGLSEQRCDLGREWSSFTIDFMTVGFAQLVTDGRIMFRFAGEAEAGDSYSIDNVVMERLGDPSEPRVVRHPSDIAGGVGQRVMFRVAAPYDDARFQWQRNGKDIPGANLTSYGTPTISASDSGTVYSCRVSWFGGTVQTRSAVLSVRSTPVSLVSNHQFDNGVSGWSVFPGSAASLSVGATDAVAHLAVHSADASLQLLTTGIELVPGAQYRLRFRAQSSSGHDFSVGFIKHTSTYTPYVAGLRTFDLTSQWAEYSMLFTAGGMPGIVADARMMFWFSPYASEGDEYLFDDVMLEELVSGTFTEVKEGELLEPLEFALEQNTPNPFNPETSISFTIAERQTVRLVVYDLLGREVVRLADGVREAGHHTVRFRGEGVASGIYFYRLETARQVATKKMMMLR
jgi:hypothetical protein